MTGPIGGYIVRWSAEHGEYVARHPSYPSFSWVDPDPHTARESLANFINQIPQGDLPRYRHAAPHNWKGTQ